MDRKDEEIMRLQRKNMRLTMILSEVISYINDEEVLLYLLDKVDKIKFIE